MLSIFGIFNFLNPLYLLGGLFSAILILAYLRKKPQRKLVYSSLYLLKKLPKQILPRKKFSPPLRFFLELLALISLIIALASPVLNLPSRKTAIVIDTTLSMQAKNSNFETRIDLAKKEIKKWIEQNANNDLFSIYTTAPNLTALTKNEVSASEAIRFINQVEASFSDDKAESEIAELIKKNDFGKLLFASDRQIIKADTTIDRILDSENNINTKIVGLYVGQDLGNFYVQHLDVKKTTIDKNEEILEASIGLAAKKATSVEIIFFQIADDNKKEVIGKNSLIIYPNKINQSFIALEPQEGSVRYQVLVKANSADFIDSIDADNIAILNTKGSSNDVLLVSDEDTNLGLDQIKYFSINKISPEKFNQLTEEQIDKSSLIIFHKLAPNKFPKKSSLFILPPGDNKLFSVIDRIENVKISSWSSEHSITSYLKVPLIKPTQAYIFSVPSWMKSIVNAEEGSVLIAGESRGYRFAALGFEILPFEGAKTLGLSVLNLNLLNWLANTKELSQSSNLYYPDESKTDEIKTISFNNLFQEKNIQQKSNQSITNWFIYLALTLLFIELLLVLLEKRSYV